MSKFWVQQTFFLGESRPVVDPILFLTHHTNTGAAFGMGNKFPAILTGVSFIFIIAVAGWLFAKRRDPALTGFAVLPILFIFAGAIGNGMDRYRYGYVIDFIDFRVWPIFNVADSWITIGAVMLIVQNFVIRRKR
jgi:signal peptidase II